MAGTATIIAKIDVLRP